MHKHLTIEEFLSHNRDDFSDVRISSIKISVTPKISSDQFIDHFRKQTGYNFYAEKNRGGYIVDLYKYA